MKFKINNLKLTINKYKNGFTLIELLIVVAIVGVLASLLMVNFVGIRQRARDAQRKSDLRQVQSALEMYRADQGSYPLAADFPNCGLAFTASGSTYMQKVPCDPLNTGENIYQRSFPDGIKYCLRMCLENANDSERDEIKYSSNNPTISGCTFSVLCSTGKSITFQNP